MKWIPVSERLPDSSDWVLVTVEVDGKAEVGMAKPLARRMGFDSPEIAPRVTHWMPLPEPA